MGSPRPEIGRNLARALARDSYTTRTAAGSCAGSSQNASRSNRANSSGGNTVCRGSALTAERILVAQECIGDGCWLLKKGIDYAKERVVFDRPIGQNQGVQFLLARAYAELEAADMICRRAAALFDAGNDCGAEANMAKLLASEATWHAAEATFGPLAALPSPGNTTSSANGARPASTRPRRSRPI